MTPKLSGGEIPGSRAGLVRLNHDSGSFSLRPGFVTEPPLMTRVVRFFKPRDPEPLVVARPVGNQSTMLGQWSGTLVADNEATAFPAPNSDLLFPVQNGVLMGVGWRLTLPYNLCIVINFSVFLIGKQRGRGHQCVRLVCGSWAHCR